MTGWDAAWRGGRIVGTLGVYACGCAERNGVVHRRCDGKDCKAPRGATGA